MLNYLRACRRGLLSSACLLAAGAMSVNLPASASAAEHDVLMRFPTVSSDRVAFVARGNLWIVPRAGGVAVRLTDDQGQIFNPRFSPDGKRIAFTWRREGGSDVYVVATTGGVPQRLTHGPALDAYDNLVTGWSPDGERITFLSLRQSSFYRQYDTFGIAATGGLATRMPLGHSGLSSFSPDGKRIIFDRTFRNLGGERWKRYKGGQAPDLYTYDFATRKFDRMTDWDGTDTAPMWIGHHVYFLSDRGPEARQNIWEKDLETGKFRQLTHFDDYDIDMPSAGPGAIAFQQGGKLQLLDLAREIVVPIEVAVGADQRMAPRDVSASPSLAPSDWALADDGSTFLSTRGEIILAAAGSAKNLTQSTASAEGRPAVSPDGKWLAFITDRSGSQQLAIMPVSGGRVKSLTRIGSSLLHAPRWSPDGQRLLVADASNRLWLVDANGSRTRQIAFDPQSDIRDASFSPDGKWVAYSRQRVNQMRAIHIWEVASGEDREISSEMVSDHRPVFSRDGQILFFVSQRREFPFVSDRDLDGTIATLKSEALYSVGLPGMEKADGAAAAWNRLTDHAKQIPNQLAGGIADVESRDLGIIYLATATAAMNGDLPGEASSLRVFDPVSGTDRLLAKDVDGYTLAPSGGAALLRRGREWYRVDLREKEAAEKLVDLMSLKVRADPHAESSAMLDQAWRLTRDLFWDPQMNGAHWEDVRKAYTRLAPLIGSHEDLLYLIGEMQGELSTSHMFVGGGDHGDTRRAVQTALLGADFEIDPVNGLYRFQRIYRGDQSRSRFAAPLGDPGLDVREGDYLLAIDGRRLTAPTDPFGLLLEKSGPLILTLARTADGPTRSVMIKPVQDESEIRKLDWIARNREAVEKRSGGRLGYIYLTDFFTLGSEDFVRQYYPQAAREGLIIDVRGNRGGFTSQWVLDILRRPLAGTFVNRHGAVMRLPGAATSQRMVVITDMNSKSDAEQFAHYFREFKLGKVVGERTAGSVRGIDGRRTLIDGSSITVPKDALRNVAGELIIEPIGVAPDISVSSYASDDGGSTDAMLDAAIAQLLERP